MFSKKATKIDEIFTVDSTLCIQRQIDGEDFANFRGLLRKYELYKHNKIEGNCCSLFCIEKKLNDTNFVHSFEDGTKLKITNEI